MKAPIIRTRPNPPPATQQHSGQKSPRGSQRRRDHTLRTSPYLQRDKVKPSFLWQRSPTVSSTLLHPGTAFLLHVYIEISGRSVSCLSPAQSRRRRQSGAGKDRHPVTAPTRMGEVPKNKTERTDVRAAEYFYTPCNHEFIFLKPNN